MDTPQLNYTPVRMDPDPARTKTREVSSRLLEMAGVKGRVAESGMRATGCDSYADDRFAMEHSWSLYGLAGDQVDTGMETLRQALDENGWKITRENKTNSVDQHPEIYAVNETEHFSVKAAALNGGGKEPMLAFTVYSACYRAASPYAANHA
ncbi:hypothetical protein [Streptomyces sp. NPDC097981]|uniref:hypothetical protein n=1 Tax=Streptomyces sp. NPDC097981 TaxID=3155428 RepID=UPI00332BE4D6